MVLAGLVEGACQLLLLAWRRPPCCPGVFCWVCSLAQAVAPSKICSACHAQRAGPPRHPYAAQSQYPQAATVSLSSLMQRMPHLQPGLALGGV